MYRLSVEDPTVAGLVEKEWERTENTLDLIASESHAPVSVLETLGSILNNKTIEGYPGKRFHAGCQFVDEIEEIAVTRCKTLFGAEHCNVQPHSGTSANLGVYFSVLEIGDKILSMNLAAGGHLSHGHRASITSKCFQFDHYSVDKQSEMIDYDQVRSIALKFRPRMIVAGASSYARKIDYKIFAAIAEEISAFLFVDLAHTAGLVAAGIIPSPVSHSDFVTFTCYKTMMGCRGGVILCRSKHAANIDRAVFPGCQGTSAVNLIAAKAVAFKLAETPKFMAIQNQIVANAKLLAEKLQDKGFRIVSGGTDTHQVLIDLSSKAIKGLEAQNVLESVGINVNRNVTPRDADSPGKMSGLRLGTTAITARGMTSKEVSLIASLLDQALCQPGDLESLKKVANSVSDLCRQFPVYRGRAF